MKTLVVYYSLSGNNRLLAQTLSERLQCAACELRPSKPRTKLDLLIDAFSYRTPANEPVAFDLGAYERVVLVAPVWNARVAAPMRSFARQLGRTNASYAFITACAGRADQTMRLHRELTRVVGRRPSQLVEIEAQQLLPRELRKGRNASNYRFTPRDMVTLAPQLERFIRALASSEPRTSRAPKADVADVLASAEGQASHP